MSYPSQRVFLLAFTRYTQTVLANERVVESAGDSDDQELVLLGPTEEDVFPAWADESHTVDCVSELSVRTNNLQELHDLIGKGWRIESAIPMAGGCSCLMVLQRASCGPKQESDQHVSEMHRGTVRHAERYLRSWLKFLKGRWGTITRWHGSQEHKKEEEA
ncbi:MAG: hypothetical protein HN341_05165 [Verrucomicrobia bacterium]|nr:hypothetical protein [Verrucomicrobiota bacterium]